MAKRDRESGKSRINWDAIACQRQCKPIDFVSKLQETFHTKLLHVDYPLDKHTLASGCYTPELFQNQFKHKTNNPANPTYNDLDKTSYVWRSSLENEAKCMYSDGNSDVENQNLHKHLFFSFILANDIEAICNILAQNIKTDINLYEHEVRIKRVYYTTQCFVPSTAI